MPDDVRPDDIPHDDVRHDADGHRFVIEASDGTAELVYRLAGERMTVLHTEVPEALGGRGLGGRLVRAAADHATSEGLTVVPSCPFARRWLGDHAAEVADLHIDWSPTR